MPIEKTKKPFYKRWWFILIAGIVVIGVVFGSQGTDSADSQTTTAKSEETAAEETQTETIEYAPATATILLQDLDSNPLNASNTWKDQYVEVTGTLSNIDSSGKYISLAADDGAIRFSSIQVYLQDDDQRQAVAAMQMGDSVTVKGKVTDVGEVLGYSIQADQID